jgi:hypothetical protein
MANRRASFIEVFDGSPQKILMGIDGYSQLLSIYDTSKPDDLIQ